MIDPVAFISGVPAAIVAASATWGVAAMTQKSKAREIAAQAAQAKAAEAKERREARLAEDAQRAAERREFVDQLQEERQAALDRAASKDKIIDAMWRDKAASREHVAALRRQVWSGDEPPPVTPPPGYIE